LSEKFGSHRKKLGKPRTLEAAHDLHEAQDETEDFAQTALVDIHRFEVCVMGQVMRQIGVVIGLTVFLTFPVTVVSGAGSQKHSDHSARFAGEEASNRMPGVSKAGEQTDRSRPMRHEPRR